MKELTLKREIGDTFAIIAAVGSAIFFFNAWPIKIMLVISFVMSAIEIYVTSKRKDIECYPTKAAEFFTLHMYAILLVACVAVLTIPMSQKYYALTLGLALSSDAAGLICGRLFGYRHPAFSRRISPNKTWAGYLGSLVATIAFGTLGIAVMHLEWSARNIILVAMAAAVCSFGDLVASGTKRELGIKHSSDYTLDVPVLRQLEVLMRSRHGYLDCMDSVSCMVIFAILLFS